MLIKFPEQHVEEENIPRRIKSIKFDMFECDAHNGWHYYFPETVTKKFFVEESEKYPTLRGLDLGEKVVDRKKEVVKYFNSRIGNKSYMVGKEYSCLLTNFGYFIVENTE